MRDYRWISEVLPGREAPMDIDAVVEKSGHVLIQEFKPAGVALPLGQRLTLRAFVRLGCDVWVVWEEDSAHVQVGAMDRHGNVKFVERMTVRKYRKRIVEWREDILREAS
jgi:hypothetical protein